MSALRRAAELVAINLAVFLGLLIVLEGAAWLAGSVKNLVAPGDASAHPTQWSA